MPNISTITLPDNTSYNVKDTAARGSYQNLGGREEIIGQYKWFTVGSINIKPDIYTDCVDGLIKLYSHLEL